MRHYRFTKLHLEPGESFPVKSKLIELPEIVIWRIAKHLNYQDHRNLRLTCKKLKAIIGQRTARSLHLFVKVYPFERVLYHTDEPISYADTLHVIEKRGFNILRSIKFKNQFTELLTLTIYCFDKLTKSTHIRIEDLNCFKSLIHLEIEGLEVRNKVLCLPNLKIAVLENNSDASITVRLDCPKLKVLGLSYYAQPTLTAETSNSIEHLYINEADSAIDRTEENEIYSLLPKLSTVCFRSEKRSKEANKLVLALLERRVQLPQLKRIRLIKANRLDGDTMVLRNLANLKSNRATGHIEVQINSKVMAADELTQMLHLLDAYEFSFYYLELEEIQYIIRNPTLHCLLPGAQDLRLWCNEDVALSKQLIEKLEGLKFLTLGEGIEMDADCFEEFFECVLRRCRGLRHLTIGCVCIKQEQLDRMPHYLQELTLLCFKRNFSLGNFDFDFLKNFRNLATIDFDDFNIQKKTMMFLLENCAHQPDFHLKLHGRQRIWIFAHPNEHGEFRMECCSKSTFRPDRRSELSFESLEKGVCLYYQNNLFNKTCTCCDYFVCWLVFSIILLSLHVIPCALCYYDEMRKNKT